MTSLRIALLAGLAFATVAPAARADIITALSATPVAVNGGYSYTYNVQLAGSTQLDGINTKDRDGRTVGESQFGTVYDFGPLLMDSSGNPRITTTGLISTLFKWTFNNTDIPPAQTAPNDNPNLLNIRFIYEAPTTLVYVTDTGSSTPNGTTDSIAVSNAANNLGTFTVVSPFGPTLNNSLAYDGVSYKSTNNTQQQNLGLVSGPQVSVPEPASLAVLGMGLLGLGFVRRRNAG